MKLINDEYNSKHLMVDTTRGAFNGTIFAAICTLSEKIFAK